MAEADAPLTERRRGRPSPARAAAIEGAIRAAALEVFLAGGYEAANMDDVAARAGISKGTLYTRFPSKQALFRAVVEAQAQRVADPAERGFDERPRDLEMCLRFHAKAIVASFRSEAFVRLDRLVTMARTSFPDLAGPMPLAPRTDYGDLLAETLAEAARREGREGLDWKFVSGLLIHGIWGWQHNESQFRVLSDAECEAFCGKLVDMILAAARR